MNVQIRTLQLSDEELTVLVEHLRRHLAEVDQELVRTDNPVLQHAIARELHVLEGVVARLQVEPYAPL
jgi:HPt (histidine-containing phosphotransfer) domain-containing protein